MLRGSREATLTHHLNAMDARGLVTRTRDTANRRVQVVALTEAGEAAFVRLRDTAIAFDAKLREGLVAAVAAAPPVPASRHMEPGASSR